MKLELNGLVTQQKYLKYSMTTMTCLSVSLCFLCLGCSKEEVVPYKSMEKNIQKFESVALVDPTNEKVLLDIKNILDSAGIENYAEGSIIYSVFVRSSDLTKAKAALLAQENLKSYVR